MAFPNMTKIHLTKFFIYFLSLIFISSVAQAQVKTIKVGTLKLIIGMTPFLYEKVAETGYKFEVSMFDTPADVAAAVSTNSVDVGMVGYPVAVLSYSNGQPIKVVGASTDGGFGIIASAKSEIRTILDLKGKKVAVQPASTVETLFRLRLKEVGLSEADLQIVRLMFQDMAGALARGDIDAFVGVEPGPSISITNGVGRVIDLPYKTPAGGLNLVLVSNNSFIDKNPESIVALLKTHRRAVDLAQQTPALYVDAALGKLGIPRPIADLAMKNIFLQWQINADWFRHANFYNTAMVEVKQIRNPPDMKNFVNTNLMTTAFPK